jgi:hypothetical protein
MAPEWMVVRAFCVSNHCHAWWQELILSLCVRSFILFSIKSTFHRTLVEDSECPCLGFLGYGKVVFLTDLVSKTLALSGVIEHLQKGSGKPVRRRCSGSPMIQENSSALGGGIRNTRRVIYWRVPNKVSICGSFLFDLVAIFVQKLATGH